MVMARQISAFIPPETRDELERQARATGMKKGHIIEQALLHHLQALNQLPLDVIVSPRVVVSRASGEQLLARLKEPRRPNQALRRLMRAPDED